MNFKYGSGGAGEEAEALAFLQVNNTLLNMVLIIGNSNRLVSSEEEEEEEEGTQESMAKVLGCLFLLSGCIWAITGLHGLSRYRS
ncbi:hypothetical protein OIU84_022353 [Salix udensis]|uniref:Uncharacterized protein n=1 Tax=Salix udensis TaxID=889485 RepID=A0AAD6KNF2_9ROSI|nr:hypothetical protein OIU84_022353 [Salix udensis]